MNTIIILALLAIILYTFGFAVTLWKAKQKISAFAVGCLVLLTMVLPFFSIFKN